MKNIVFYGKSNKDKINLILYLSKVLSQEKVLIVSNTIKHKVNPFEYIEGVDILNYNSMDEIEQIKYAPYKYCFYDIEDKNINDIDKSFFITNTYKEIVDSNKEVIQKIDIDNTDLIILNLYEYYKINEQYIYDVITNFKEFAFKDVYTYYFVEKDKAVMIMNEYENSLDIKKLSNQYKKLLSFILKDILEDDEKTINKLIKKVERSK